MTGESYAAFAYAYDKALGTRFFRAVRRVLDDVLENHPTPKRTHLDIACGTAHAVEYFRAQGWRSTGVDASLPMLQVARARMQSAPSRAMRLVAGDIRALPLRSTFARITCLYDSLNHMLDRDDLVATFRSVRGVMSDDSLFLFDMNHPDVYPEVWGYREPYIAAGDDYRLQIDTSYRSRERLARGVVSGWAKLPNGERVEIRETHRQRAYREKEILDALGEAGLEAVEIRDFDPFGDADDLDAAGVKLFFVCGIR
ncbi:MAG TPA: class I SAM-dependent methyltransferase [Thermoanaerobaculia bacterium]|nr:class I SAM-dependent methyltransferase [Thermoanaerobaculia bacterium]